MKYINKFRNKCLLRVLRLESIAEHSTRGGKKNPTNFLFLLEKTTFFLYFFLEK